MTDIKTYLETETELPVADTAFDRQQKLPFVAFIDKTAQDGDDFNARIVEHNLTVEFYAERLDNENEGKLEKAFEKMNWKFEKERQWLPDEKMFETIFTMNFMEKR